MARDGKLREVLDTLSDEPAQVLPRHDRELMESVLRRLKIQEARRPRPYAPRPDRSMSELESARDEARRRLEELESLRQQHGQEQEELRRLAAERDELREQQRELEDRLASLEASSHGGPLSYVEEDDEIVEFARVDLGEGDDMLEFQYLGASEQDGFEAPDKEAWEEGTATDAAPSWDEPSWGDETVGVDWDAGPEEDEPEAAPWHGGTQRDPWAAEEEPAGGAAGAEETASWEEPEADDPFAGTSAPGLPAHAAPHGDTGEGLDERTQDELAELEKQLADLEREIEDREKRERRERA